MNEQAPPAAPKLLKARAEHSRWFGALFILLVLVTEPAMSPDHFVRASMLWLGYALVILGAFGRAYCSVYIGGRKNDTVVREGVFAVVRNPLYVFSFIATVGIGLQSGMIMVALGLAGAFVWYYPMVVEKEEAFLKHKFGKDYETYMREVPRWQPDFKLWREPEQVEARPRFVRRTLMDAAIFFLPMPCFVILQALHSHNILPVWLILP